MPTPEHEAEIARIQLMRSYANDDMPFDFQDPKLLATLLLALQERLPDDLSLGGWESPTAEDHAEATDEVLDLVGIAYRAAQIHGLV
jgi:hypothetical protein